jgi:hypothetical protein
MPLLKIFRRAYSRSLLDSKDIEDFFLLKIKKVDNI